MDRYEEAMNRMLQWEKEHPNGYVIEDMKKFVFPELKESEDERIRKAISAAICGTTAEAVLESNGVKRVDALAYLEKQKEQKPKEIHIDNPNIQKFDPDVKVTTSDSSADGKELLYVSNKSYDIGFRDGVASVKPAEWSEKHIADIFEKVGLAEIVREQGNDKLTNAVQAAMIELSKGCEWSEEDKEMLDSAIKFIEHSAFSTIGKGKNNVLAWLKSLRPQHHWKPSEKQIDALNSIILTGSFTYVGQVQDLISLKDELKKQM